MLKIGKHSGLNVPLFHQDHGTEFNCLPNIDIYFQSKKKIKKQVIFIFLIRSTMMYSELSLLPRTKNLKKHNFLQFIKSLWVI